MNKIKDYIKENKALTVLLSVLFILINYLSYYFRKTVIGDFLFGISYIFEKPTILLRAFPISLNPKDLMYSLLITTVILFIVLDRKLNKKNFRHGVEHGSARWGSFDELKDLYDRTNPNNNIMLSENINLALKDDNIEPKNRRNKNILLVGGSGSGKTRFFVKPSIMDLNADFVVTDPKGTILNELGYLLSKNNYNIKVLNLIDFDKSMRYNPLAYIEKEQDILRVIETIIRNTSSTNQGSEDFWVKAEKLLYQALFSVVLDYFPKEEQHLGTIIDLLELAETREDDEDYINALDDMFMQIEEEEPNAFAVKQYKAYKLASGKTAKSILISCATRLATLNIPAVRDLLSEDEFNLSKLGNDTRPTAIFLIVSDNDPTFNFIASIMYSQMFTLLTTIADNKYQGFLPRHIRFLLDEFANIGEIPDFESIIATIRSRNMSAVPILQTLSQLKAIYKDHSDTIVGNCDTFIFLGGKEDSTLKMVSNQLGKQTIDDYNTSRTRSQSDSFGQNYSKLGRELMTPDELQVMDRSKCIVMILGVNPFKDNKYEITNHKNYKYHGSPAKFDITTGEIIKPSKYWFNIEKYVEQYRNKIAIDKAVDSIVLTTLDENNELEERIFV